MRLLKKLILIFKSEVIHFIRHTHTHIHTARLLTTHTHTHTHTHKMLLLN